MTTFPGWDYARVRSTRLVRFFGGIYLVDGADDEPFTVTGSESEKVYYAGTAGTHHPHPEERPLGRVSKDGQQARSRPSFETPRKGAAPQDEGL
jgi:hypothetical protein